MITSDSIERVARGVALLDRYAPGWEHRLDLQSLDISDPSSCVCGQVFMAEAVTRPGIRNGYAYAMLHVDEDFASADHGFVLASDGDTWAMVVKARLDSGATSDRL